MWVGSEQQFTHFWATLALLNQFITWISLYKISLEQRTQWFHPQESFINKKHSVCSQWQKHAFWNDLSWLHLLFQACLVFTLHQSNQRSALIMTSCPRVPTSAVCFPSLPLYRCHFGRCVREVSAQTRLWVLTLPASGCLGHTAVCCLMCTQSYHIPAPQTSFPPADAWNRNENDGVWFVRCFQSHPELPAQGDAHSDGGWIAWFAGFGLRRSQPGSDLPSSWIHCRAALHYIVIFGVLPSTLFQSTFNWGSWQLHKFFDDLPIVRYVV